MPLKIKELPDEERPYEKLELYGEKSLTNAELLAIIIKTGTKEETSVNLAQRILKLNDTNNDDLQFLSNLTIEELKQIKGIGNVKAIQIKAVCEIAKRISMPNNYKKVKIAEPSDVAKLLMGMFRCEKQEIIKLIILNSKNEVLKIKDVAVGSISSASISTQGIFAEPIKMGAPKIILSHNHPSGDSTPSTQDIECTKIIYDMGKLLGIELLDHLVIGNGNYTSIFSKVIINERK